MANAIVTMPSRGAETSDALAKWVIAALIAVALIVGFYAIFRNSPTAPSSGPTANVQATIPNTGGSGATDDTQ